MLVQFGRALLSSKLLIASFVVESSSTPVVIHVRYSYFVSSSTIRLRLSIDHVRQRDDRPDSNIGNRQVLLAEGDLSTVHPINGCADFNLSEPGDYEANLMAEKVRFTKDLVVTGLKHVAIGSGLCPTLDAGDSSTASSKSMSMPQPLSANSYITDVYDEYNGLHRFLEVY